MDQNKLEVNKKNKINFDEVNQRLLPSAESYLRQWLPGGKIMAGEYCCGDLSGKPGKSLKINLKNGKWQDYATGEKGGDLISLYAAIHKIKQPDAALQLSNSTPDIPVNKLSKNDTKPTGKKPVPVPAEKTPPTGRGNPVYEYKTLHGKTLFYVERIDKKDGSKVFLPWTWLGNEWQKRQWPEDRPLYGEEILKDNNTPVVIVEGEKACLAARQFCGDELTVLTWAGGAKAVHKTNWAALKGREITIWPDNDSAGKQAANEIAFILRRKFKTDVMIIDVKNRPKGWDAADSEFKTAESFIEWAILNRYEYEEPKKDEKKKTYISNASMGLFLNGNSNPYCHEANAIKILNIHEEFKGKIKLNELNQQEQFVDGENVKDIEGATLVSILSFIQGELGLDKMRKDIVKNAVSFVAENNKYNPRAERLLSLKWDGVNRIDDFATMILGADDEGIKEKHEYHQKWSKAFFMSMIDRTLHPGCKHDTLFIIEGKQGIMKSSMLNVIGGEDGGYRRPASSASDRNKFLRSLIGAMVVEIAEIENLKGARLDLIKTIMDTKNDNINFLYKGEKLVPRSYIMVATTNESNYIPEDEENRRFAPVVAKYVKMDTIKENLDQYFAEAIHRLSQGEEYHDLGEYLKVIHAQKMELHDWEDTVRHSLMDTKSGFFPEFSQGKIGSYITSDYVMKTVIYKGGALDRGPGSWRRGDVIRLAKLFKTRFRLKEKSKRINGIKTRIYVRTEVSTI